MSENTDTEDDSIVERLDTSVIVAGTILAFVVIGVGLGLYFDGGSGILEPSPDFDFPEGADASEVNATKLSEIHNETLRQTSFVIAFESTVSQGGQTISNRRNYNYDGDRALVTDELNGGVSTRYVDFEEETSYSETVFNGNTTYASNPVVDDTPFTATNYLTQRIGVFETEFVNTTTIDGTEVATYEFVGLKDDATIDESNFSVDGTMAITEDGYAKEVQVTVESTAGPAAGDSATQSLSVDDVDSTTVEEPDWLGEAREQTEGEE